LSGCEFGEGARSDASGKNKPGDRMQVLFFRAVRKALQSVVCLPNELLRALKRIINAAGLLNQGKNIPDGGRR